ncbi:MAG: SDR family oxidoreductase [Pseudohongiellaceae bacterium]|nr:SDR family oxidoreductase [Pseudohongiellaceae bacterium]
MDESKHTQLPNTQDLFSVKGRVALVTGGTSGIGYAMAEGLLRGGARVYICSRKENKCNEAVESLSKLGECIAIAADISDKEQRKRLVDTLFSKELQGLSILINNAGSNWGAPIEEYPDDAFEKVMRVNVNSVFALTRDLLPLLEKAGTAESPARVINIGSMDALQVPIVSRVPTFAYSASKAALHHLTETLAVDLGPRNITVNAIAPGFFESKMTDVVLDKFGKDIEDECPLGRIGRPSDIVGVMQFLASQAGAYVNGAILPVDGGTHISKGRREWMQR